VIRYEVAPTDAHERRVAEARDELSPAGLPQVGGNLADGLDQLADSRDR